MTPEQQATAHDANFVGFFQAAAGVLDAGTQATYGSVPVVTTRVPAPVFNGGWVTQPATPTDGKADSALATVSITVTPVNDAPVAG